MSSWFEFCREMGLGVTLAIAVFVAFFFLLKWVLKVSSDQLESMAKERSQNAEERKTWIMAQESFIKQMGALQTQMEANMATNRAFHDSVKEAHNFQRQEHKEMISALGRINGYNNGHN